MILRVTLALLLTLPLIYSSAPAADWPHWMGPDGRNVSAETNLPESFDSSVGDGPHKNVAWSVRLATVAYGCPTVSNGRVFIGTSVDAARNDRRFSYARGGALECLDEATGQSLWRLVAPERLDGFPDGTHMTQQKWGICSSPTVDGDRLYIVANGDDVLCLDVNGMANGNDGPFKDEAAFISGKKRKSPVKLIDTDADIIWRYDIPRELGVAPHDVASCSVAIHGSVLYLSTSNGVGKDHPAGPLKPDAPGFIALEKQTGRLLATDDKLLGKGLFHTQWTSPIIAKVGRRTQVIFSGGDGWCYGFEALKKVPDEPVHLKVVWKYDCNPPEFRKRDGKPIPYYHGDVRTYKKAVRTKQPDAAKRNNGDGSYIGPSQIIASPVFDKGRVYIAIGQDPAHGRGRGMLHCIDATKKGDITQSGKVWSYDGIERTMCTVAVHDGLVYAADLPGRLHCLDAKTGEICWIQETGHETWGGPLIADGKVYFNTRQSFRILKAGRKPGVIFDCNRGSECAPIAANGAVIAFLRGRLYSLRKDAVAQRRQ